MMSLSGLVRANRSYRRFDESVTLDRATLEGLVDLARQSPSAANLQPLRYRLCVTREECGRVFPLLRWAGYLKDWAGPAPGERPAAYIVILSTPDASAEAAYDAGIACEAMLLGAVERGLGGCIVGSVDRERLRGVLRLPADHRIMLVVALGKPCEQVELEEVGPDGDIRYWRDGDGTHHVPKRRLADVIVAEAAADPE